MHLPDPVSTPKLRRSELGSTPKGFNAYYFPSASVYRLSGLLYALAFNPTGRTAVHKAVDRYSLAADVPAKIRGQS